ncbi:MAG: 50S ribosomal protein L5 [Aeoliella sp.]
MTTTAPRLAAQYEKELRPALAKSLGRTNPHALPMVEKIVISMGVGKVISDKKNLEDALAALTEITGQKPLVCKARKSVANFKLRQGMSIGAKVTLRGARMYEFLDRLIALVLPRVRDFRGLSDKAFDGNGNYSLGLSEILVFPELNPDKYTRSQGMNIAICISGGSDDDSRELLKMYGFPFKRPDAEM